MPMSSLALHHQPAGDEARVLPRLEHPGEVVQRGVDVGAADRLDEAADDVVVLVAVAVVADRGPVDRLLEQLQRDVGRPRPAAASSAVSARRASPPASRTRWSIASSSSVDLPAEAALVGQRPADDGADVVVGQRLEGEQQAARQQRAR